MNPTKFLSVIILVAVVVISASCKKVPLPDSQAQALIGRWKVLSVNSGWGGNTESDGKTTFEFTKHGKFYEYHNMLLKRTTSFSFTQRRSIYSNETQYIIDYKKGTDQSFKIVGDKLYLNAEAFDGGGYVLTKK
ncbi:MAG: hypothetical protein V4580_12830 [Bacteroidota bacterium]